MKKPLITVSGPSGGGKNASLALIMPLRPQLEVIVTTTSRQMREGEQDGVHYYFRSPKKFEDMINKGKFFEWVKRGEDYYGTEKIAIDNIWDHKKIPVANVDLTGVRKYRDHFPSTFSIFVMPRKLSELEERLRTHGGMPRAKIAWRLRKAEQEMVDFKECCDAAFPIGTGLVATLASLMLCQIDPYVKSHCGFVRKRNPPS